MSRQDRKQAELPLWERWLLGRWSDLPNERYRLKAVLLHLFSLASILVTLFFGVLSVYHDHLAFAFLDFSAAFLLMLNAAIFRASRKLQLATIIAVSIAAYLLLGLMALAAAADTTFLWVYLMPLATFFLLGHRKGLVVVVPFTVGLLTILFSQRNTLLAAVQDSVFLTRFVGSYGLVVVFAYLFERFRHRAQSRLEQEIISRKEAEVGLIQAKEAAEKATRIKSEFLANMSHEIRTPLHGIIGIAQLMQENSLSDQNREHTQIIQSSASTLLDIINQILDLARVEEGKVNIIEKPFDLQNLIHLVVNLQRPLATKKNLVLAIDIDPNVPRVLIGDPLLIRQVLINLVSNAVKFTEAGSVRIAVELSQKSVPGLELRLRVSDTGIGVPANKRELIFEKFTQADGSSSRDYGGTGLGLAISRQLVALMGGQLKLDSQEGKGSSFWFSLCLAPATDPVDQLVETPPSPVTKIPQIRARVKRVLIAEDNAVNMMIAEIMLGKMGFQVDKAKDGVEATQKFGVGRYAVIFMDCQMPGMDGFEATQAIRQQESGDQHTPIVALTAHAMSGDRTRCIAAGMDDYLPKPIAVEEMVKIVGKYVELKPVAGSEAD